MRTLRNISTAWFLASPLLIFLWRRSASATWSPTVNAGLSEVIGSWKIIAIWSPRRSRRRAGDAFSRSSPSSSTSPAILPGGVGTRPMIDSAVTLFPQPDSPTMPKVRPRSSVKSTPSTARTSPRSEAKCVRSPRTSSRLFMTRDLLLDHVAVEHAPRPGLARAALQVRDEALVRLVVQAPQLREWIGVVVDSEIQLRVVFRGADQERRGLLAALVAAGGLAGFERSKKFFRKSL